MIVKNEVKISKESKKLISDVFNDYIEFKNVETHLKVNRGKIILHLYPKTDTMLNGSNKLTGYFDSLLYDIWIFNTENKTKFLTKNHDKIVMQKYCSIQYFKDLSTMICIDAPLNISLTKTIYIS